MTTSQHDTGRALARADLLSLHVPRRHQDLQQLATQLLGRCLGDGSAAILMAEDDAATRRVRLALGADCPLLAGARVPPDAWTLPQLRRLPMYYRDQPIGELVVHDVGGAASEQDLADFAAHYTVAFVNLTLDDDLARSAQDYFASLQAFEQGVILFQETEHDAISARFLGLLCGAINAPAGALFLLAEPGNLDSPLQLNQALGVPEALLEDLRTLQGQWWPRETIERPVQVIQRAADGTLGELDPAPLPPALQTLVACPLRFADLTVGLGLVLNAEVSANEFGGKLESVRRLGELGAAIFHRIRLEQIAVRSQEVETQLAIAARIQSRLLPSNAPESPQFECAWLSRAAQQVGGDYLDLVANESGDLFAVIADVSGHGINSALLMTSFRSLYRAECFRQPANHVLSALNHEIHNEAGDTGMFVTAAAFRLDRDGRQASWASAGHNPVLLHRHADGTILELDSTGPPAGFLEQADYGLVRTPLAPGDTLVLYTDGLVEAKNANDPEEMFDPERLHRIVKAGAGMTTQQLLGCLMAELRAFGGEQYDDDVSILIIKVK